MGILAPNEWKPVGMNRPSSFICQVNQLREISPSGKHATDVYAPTSTKNTSRQSEGGRLTQDEVDRGHGRQLTQIGGWPNQVETGWPRTSTAGQLGGAGDEELRATYVRGERKVADASMMDYW